MVKSMKFSCSVLLTAACASMHDQSSHYDEGSTLTLQAINGLQTQQLLLTVTKFLSVKFNDSQRLLSNLIVLN